MEKSNEPKFDPALLANTWWRSFNPNNDHAEYTATDSLVDLPDQVVRAHRNHSPVKVGLSAEDVNWNLTCVSKDGTTRLRGPTQLLGGSRSGSGCGEDDLWATHRPANHKDKTPLPNGSANFGYLDVIYVIDGGLCPCTRCAVSLLNLATRTRSTILVRPMTDYELISKHRTPLKGEFLLVYQPDATQFLVYYDLPEEAPANAGPRDVTGDPLRAWLKCAKLGCGVEATLLFSSVGQKSREVKLGSAMRLEEYPAVPCPMCKISMELVKKARGAFPTRVIRF